MSRKAIFISGRGSNLKSYLEGSKDLSDLFVFSNKKKAKGLRWAQRKGVFNQFRKFKTIEDWLDLSEFLNEKKVKTVILLGFMKILPEEFIQSFKGEVYNLHPSLLPDFPGLNSIERSLEAQKSVGVSLHTVTKDMDQGPLRMQKKVNLNSSHAKEIETLRVHDFEQQIVKTFTRLELSA